MSAAAFDPAALRGIRVLVVDDEPLLLSTFCMVLQLAGASAEQAADGEKALAMLEQQAFDVVLCDRHMPVMDGLDFLREMQQRQNTTPVLLLTGALDPGLTARAEDLQVRGTLSKPLLPTALIAAIRDAVRTPSSS